MWSNDVMNLIEKEFPFVKFSSKFKSDDLWTDNVYDGNNVIINVGHSLIGLLVISPIGDEYTKTYVIHEGYDVIKKLYQYLPKDFYLPYQRNDKINTIVDD